MPYVYHKIPKNMKGSFLYPLNQLKEKYSEIYKKEVGKYRGREKVKKRIIPFLNCYWNDVLHLTPIHPSKFKKALEDVGFNPNKKKWYKIKASKLEKYKTLIYLYKYKNKEKGRMCKKNFLKFDPNKLSEFEEVPYAAKEYYKKKFKKGESPLKFHLSPHVFYRGIINIRNAEIIND